VLFRSGYGSTRIRSLGSVRGTFTAPPRPVRQGDEFDTEFLTELFKLDLQDFTRSLNRNLRNLQVTQSEYDALVSFSYNTGTAWASLENGGSNLRTQLFRANAGQISYSEASDALLEWNKVKKKNKKTGQTVVTISNGLTRRRRAEQLLFNYKAP
jgi:GH24 family phage-related lysozyme (muramidase)